MVDVIAQRTVLILGWLIVAAWAVWLIPRVRRSYQTLVRIERVALWWWAAIGALLMTALTGGGRIFIGLAGPLMIGLGLMIALDVQRLAEHLAARRIFMLEYSPTRWRSQALFLVICGALASLALANGF